jgi:NAD(P)H dehydrogenase (quinone)
MLAVTGATGGIGGRVALGLSRLGLPQRLIVRDPSRVPDLPKAEVFQVASYGDPVAMGKALSGVDTAFLVSAHDLMSVIGKAEDNRQPVPSYNRLHQHISAVCAAAAIGVKRIVYLSFLNANPDATFILSQEHYRTEEFIRSTGLNFTFLRQGLYMDRVPAHVMNDDTIRACAGEGRATWTAHDDIADVAVAVMTGDGHDGKTYDVTGPEALTMAQTAECLSAAIGRRITYHAQTPHEVRTYRNTSRLVDIEMNRRAITGRGMTEIEVEGWVTHYLQIATGEAGIVSDTVPRLTGHPAQNLVDFLKSHPESYQTLLAR